MIWDVKVESVIEKEQCCTTGTHNKGNLAQCKAVGSNLKEPVVLEQNGFRVEHTFFGE